MTRAKQTDEELIASIKVFMAENPTATRNEITQRCNAQHSRLMRFHAEGLIKLPPKLSSKQAGRKNSSSWRNFVPKNT